MEKQIFIVPYDKTTDISHGFTKIKHNKSIWNKYNDIGVFVDKDIANKTSAMQQVMPYIIIRNAEGKYFTGTFSMNNKVIRHMGFGENIEPEDGTIQPLFQASVRSLFKNLNMTALNNLTFVGTVRDSSTNSKHLGYVFLMQDVDTDSVKLADESTYYYGEWLTQEELINKYSQFETWSKHIINFLVDNSF